MFLVSKYGCEDIYFLAVLAEIRRLHAEQRRKLYLKLFKSTKSPKLFQF